MQLLLSAAALAIGYLFGSINAAVIISGKMLDGDVRDKGSHNAGAANMARVYGFMAGLEVFALDFVKTAAAMGLSALFFGRPGAALAGAACLVGHCWPVYFKFRGGKGVTVGWAVAFFIDWRIGLLLVPIYLIAFFIKRTASISALVSALFIPIYAALFGDPIYIILLALFTAALIWARHADNIARIIKGTEKPITFGESKKRGS